jgi:hypothetical protein
MSILGPTFTFSGDAGPTPLRSGDLTQSLSIQYSTIQPIELVGIFISYTICLVDRADFDVQAVKINRVFNARFTFS